MSENSVVVSKELISRPQRVAGGKYRFLKLHPTSGSADIAIPRSSTAQAQFEFPTRNINYEKSRICGDVEIAGVTGITQVIADAATWFSSARFDLRTGRNVFDVDYLQNYTKLVNRYDKSLEEVMHNNETDAIYSHRGMGSTVRAAKRYNNTTINHYNVEGRYLTGASADGHNSSWTHYFRYKLSDIAPNTLFSKGHDIKLPEIGVLTVRLGSGNRATWNSTGVDDPDTGAAGTTGAINLKNFHILLAVQDDPVYNQMMDDKMRVGYSIPLNTVVYSRNNRTGVSQNVSITYNSGHGKRIKKIYHSAFNNTENINTSLDNNNVGSSKIVSYHVKINDSRTTEDDLKSSSTDPTAYLHMKPLLEGSSITSENIFLANFCHVEDIGRLGSPADQRLQGVRLEDAEVGESLAQDYKFEYVATTAGNALNHYTFAVVQRDMFINESSVVIN